MRIALGNEAPCFDKLTTQHEEQKSQYIVCSFVANCLLFPVFIVFHDIPKLVYGY